MATARKLGRLEKVVLREVWGSDAGEFVKWLRQSGNLEFIASALGQQLAAETPDTSSGDGTDLICRDVATQLPVALVVQFDENGDLHIGRLLRTASHFERSILVWVADHFSETQQRFVRWLNSAAANVLQVYALEIDFWRIADSPLAPTARLVCRPEVTSQQPLISSAPTETQEISATAAISQPQAAKVSSTLFLEYWLAFNGQLLQRKSTVVGQKPANTNWMGFPLQHPHFNLIATVSPRDHFIAVGLVLTGPDAKTNFHLLQHGRVAIEHEIGSPLEWQELPDKPEGRILLRRYGCDPENRNKWQDQHNWMADKLERFLRAFSLRVDALHHPEDNSAASNNGAADTSAGAASASH